MDFDAAILAHIDWKRRFAAHLQGSEKLDPATVEKDNRCELGKWIQNSSHLSKLPEFEALKKKHAAFHTAAADVIRRTNGLPSHEAEQVFQSDAVYKSSSAHCVKAIAAIRDRLAQSAARPTQARLTRTPG